MMDSYVMLSGFALWWIVGLAVLIFIGFIALGTGYIEKIKKIDRMKARIELLKCERDEWESKYMIATYTKDVQE